MIRITVNGDQREVEEGLTIATLLERFNIHQRMVVVEHNGEIVQRPRFGETQVNAGDNFEIVQMMAGG